MPGRQFECRAAVEIRATGRRLQGYAAVFDVETRIGSFREIIRRGAFSRSLADGGDVLLLADHDPVKVLARTRAQTLRLNEDSRGLAFETSDLPHTTAASDTLELVRSGIAGGASVGFRAIRDSWTGRLRTLLDVNLVEVSVVSSFPAYAQTSVSARSRELFAADLAALTRAARTAALSLRRPR